VAHWLHQQDIINRIGKMYNNRPHWGDWNCPSPEDSLPPWASLQSHIGERCRPHWEDRQRIGRPHNNLPHWEDWTCPSLEDSLPHWASLLFPVSNTFRERHCPHGRQVVAHWPQQQKTTWGRVGGWPSRRRTRCTGIRGLRDSNPQNGLLSQTKPSPFLGREKGKSLTMTVG